MREKLANLSISTKIIFFAVIKTLPSFSSALEISISVFSLVTFGMLIAFAVFSDFINFLKSVCVANAIPKVPAIITVIINKINIIFVLILRFA